MPLVQVGVEVWQHGPQRPIPSATEAPQIKDIAMATKVDQAYATLVLGYLQEKVYAKLAEKHGLLLSSTFLNVFLDDCFVVWTNNSNIDEFFRILIH